MCLIVILELKEMNVKEFVGFKILPFNLFMKMPESGKGIICVSGRKKELYESRKELLLFKL